MGNFRYKPQDNAPVASSRREPRAPSTRNIAGVLVLGETRHFRFRGRTYAVPPVSYKLGLVLTEMVTRTRALTTMLASGQGDAEMQTEYFRIMKKLHKVLWRHTRPSNIIWKWMRRFGMVRNPFRNATERELVDLTDFFLQGRTKSNVQFLSGSLESPDLPMTRMR